MNAAQIRYLEEIQMSRLAIQRVIDLEAILQAFMPSEIEDVFVNDNVNGDGMRDHASVYFFTPGYISEFKNMMTSVNFDFVSIDSSPVWVDISVSEYDFIAATDASRLYVNMSLGNNTGMIFQAVRNNCDVLADIVKRRLSRSQFMGGGSQGLRSVN